MIQKYGAKFLSSSLSSIFSARRGENGAHFALRALGFYFSLSTQEETDKIDYTPNVYQELAGIKSEQQE